MNEASNEHTPSTAAGWILILIVLLFLLTLCVVRHLQSIPADISDRIHTALQQSGYALGTIRVDGRDVILTGTVNYLDAARITAIVKSVHGVREVWTELTVVSPSLPEEPLTNTGSNKLSGEKPWQ